MREIKLRAWDHVDHRMITHEQEFIPLKVTNFGVFRQDLESKKGDRWVLLPIERFDIMEYIGTQDMTGVDIYEGDLITADGVVAIDGSICVGLIEYNMGKLSLRCLSEFDCDIYPIKTDEDKWHFLKNHAKVIGNIYKNPELLKGGKHE